MTRLQNQSGFSLIQTLIAAGILAIFVAAFADMLLNMQKEVKRNKNRQDRTLITYQIDQVVTSPYGMRGSAELPVNNALKACVLGRAAGGASSDCVANTSTQFYLLDPRDTSPDVSLRRRLAGTEADPQRYDDNSNNNCVNNCAYTIKSRFIAHCPGGEASCEHAEHLQVQLEYEPVKGKEHLMKPKTKNLIYFVNVNYQPRVVPLSPPPLNKGEIRNTPIYGYSGHPSEVQNFKIVKCLSSDENFVKVRCSDFFEGTATLQIEGVSPGTAEILLQIDDAGTENNISPEMKIPVTVNP